jgi:hypothetical protein
VQKSTAMVARFGAIATSLLITLSGVSGCADRPGPVAPDGPMLAKAVLAGSGTSSGSGTVQAPVLRRTVPLVADIVVSALVDTRAGAAAVKIPEAGLGLHFPQGALAVPTVITVTAYKGDLVVYDFQPHGIQFDTLVKVSQELKVTTAYHDDALKSSLLGGYVKDGLADIDADGVATLTETFPVFYSETSARLNKTTPSVAKFSIRHFSGYLLASGRAGQ